MDKLPDREWLRLREIDEFWFRACDSKIASEWASKDPNALFTEVPESGIQEKPTVRPGSVAIDYEAKLSALTLDFCRKLSDAAFGQRIRFKGKRKVDDSVACELIPFDYFREPRGFFSGTDKIEPFASGLDDTAIFECATSNMDTVWHEVLVNRDDFLKWFKQEFPQLQSDIAAPECRPNANLNATQMSRTGAAGRPSAMHLVKQEFERRERDGEIPRGTSAKKICEELADWYQNGPRKEHPQLPPLAFETIRKSLRDDIRRAGFTAG